MLQPLKFPDFFVVGAPRCGTTSLCRYLARNPQICFSRPKEPFYFSRQDHTPSATELKRDYLDTYFSHYEDSHRAVGEGSVSYLYSPGVIERINQLNPNARFIVLVRNPLSMLPSYHLRMQFLLQEDEPDFDTAWKLEASRLQGKNVPKQCIDSRLLLYSEAAKFSVQVKRLFEVAGRDRSHVIVFDDLKADPLAVYKQVLAFLQVDYDGQTEFEKRYASKMYRYRWLQRLFFLPATRGSKTIGTLQRRNRKYNADSSKRPSLIKRITSWNKVPMQPAPLTSQMTETIRETLKEDVAHLSQLLNRDLSFWLDKN
jgi:sulfotransferase family protein